MKHIQIYENFDLEFNSEDFVFEGDVTKTPDALFNKAVDSLPKGKDPYKVTKNLFSKRNFQTSQKLAKAVGKGLLYATPVVGQVYALGQILTSEVGKKSIKAIIDVTPFGLLKNMALAAANGDAKTFGEAYDKASVYRKKDFEELKGAIFNDLKGFGSLLKKMGVR